MQDEFKLSIYKELKREIGFEEYTLRIRKGSGFAIIFLFRLGTHVFFEELVRQVGRVG